MLGQWRVVLRQAEEAARQGRYAEAYALANRPEVADHHHAVQFRGRLALDLIARAARRGAADDQDGAVDDLDLAERMGAPPDALAAARLNLADRSAGEIISRLESGDPERALERLSELARRKIGGPALRRAHEIALAWRQGLAEGRRGEFGRACEQLDRAERLAAGLGSGAIEQAIAAAKVDLENRRKTVAPLVDAFYAVLGENRWPEILSAAEAVLGVVPEHAAARQARTNAWRQIAAIGPAHQGAIPGRGARSPGSALDRTRPDHSEPTPALDAGLEGRFLLWVDAVGGFLVCLNDRIVLGRAGDESPADVPLLGDLSRNHAVLERQGEGYLLKPQHATFVNGRLVAGQALLKDGDVIRLGATVELEFQRPSPMSATARLAVVSRHRLSLAVSSVLLMAETCIIGRDPRSHVKAPALKSPVVLYRQAGGLWCRAQGAFEVDSQTRALRAPVTLSSNILGEGFSFSLEPLPSATV